MDSAHSTTRPIAIEVSDDGYNMCEPSKELENLSRLARGARIASELSMESLGVAIERLQTLADERESKECENIL